VLIVWRNNILLCFYDDTYKVGFIALEIASFMMLNQILSFKQKFLEIQGKF